jgi:hypothetical protein
LRERLEVGALVGPGLGVDLEVAARDDDAGRRLDGEGEAVEDAVRDADRVHAEGPDLDGPARRERAQVGRDTALLQALARETERQAAAVDRGGGGLEGVGERPDVVLVPVGQDDAAQAARALGEVLEVGDDRVYAGQVGRGEEHPRVQEQHMLLPLEDERVQSELTEAAEGNESDRRRVVVVACSQPLAPAGTALRASQSAARSTTDSVSALLDPSRLRNLKYSLRLA